MARAPRPAPITFGVTLEFGLTSNLPFPHDEGSSSEAKAFLGCQLAERTFLHIASECDCFSEDEPIPCPGCKAVEDTAKQQYMGVACVYGDFAPFDHAHNAKHLYYYIKKANSVSHNTELIGLAIATPVRGGRQILIGMPEMRELLGALKEIGEGYLAINPPYTSLRVHVGSQLGLSVQDAQKAITLAALLEFPLLTACQAPARRSVTLSSNGAMLSNSVFNTPSQLNAAWQARIRSRSGQQPLDQHLPPASRTGRYWAAMRQRLLVFLHAVWTAGTIEELEKGLLDRQRNRVGLALSLRGMPPHSDPYNTLDFSYAAATFNHDFVLHWTKICAHLVSTAKYPTPVFARIVTNVMRILDRWDPRRPENCWGNLLLVLGMPQHHIALTVAGLRNHRAGEDSSVDEFGYVFNLPDSP